MRFEDISEFVAALSLCCRLLSRGMYEPKDDEVEAWFTALMQFELTEVVAALVEHQQEALKPPLIAEITARIKASRTSAGGAFGLVAPPGVAQKARTREELVAQREMVNAVFAKLGRSAPHRRNSLEVSLVVDRLRQGGRLHQADIELLEREHQAGHITDRVLAELGRAGFTPRGAQPCH